MSVVVLLRMMFTNTMKQNHYLGNLRSGKAQLYQALRAEILKHRGCSFCVLDG